MADTHETIAEIIAEMRRQADEIERDVAEKMKRNKMISDSFARELVADIRREANRLEAAHRRERGNAAKLREALDESRRIASDLGGCRLNDYWKLNEIVRVCEAALSAPPRNCDVGTVDDQKDRFLEFCDDEKGPREHCRNCRLCDSPDCELAWAQMPYEEGGDK